MWVLGRVSTTGRALPFREQPLLVPGTIYDPRKGDLNTEPGVSLEHCWVWPPPSHTKVNGSCGVGCAPGFHNVGDRISRKVRTKLIRGQGDGTTGKVLLLHATELGSILASHRVPKVPAGVMPDSRARSNPSAFGVPKRKTN